MAKKQMLDELLVGQGLAADFLQARALIMAGTVYVDGRRETKAGECFPAACKVEVRSNRPAYVSRGGLKLEKAAKLFAIDLTGLICMDVGASTGGFTDYMLQHGAKMVYSVDVGYGQLDWKLRTDKRVVNMERTNIRRLKAEMLAEKLDFASVDVSFISLSKVLPVLAQIGKEHFHCVCLIKPQFEARRELVGKNGVVRDARVHAEVLERVWDFTARYGFAVKGLTYSPIRGAKGNIEYLMYLQKDCHISERTYREEDGQTHTLTEPAAAEQSQQRKALISRLVVRSHANLDPGDKQE